MFLRYVFTVMLALSSLSATSVVPRPLRPGDRVAIVSPAGIVAPQVVRAAVSALRDRGYDAYAAPHAFDRDGIFAGSDSARLADLRAALNDTTVRAVLCSRGGYGCVRLLPELMGMDLRADPKWLVGFSDVSALHALMGSQGVASVHGPMCRHIAERGADDPCFLAEMGLLEGRPVTHTFPSDSLNVCGAATGRLVGGNLAVIADLVSTPLDVFAPGCILAIEDVGEPVYKVERIMYQLLLSGRLQGLAGIIVGQFTKYTPDATGRTMEQMLHPLLDNLGIPVAYNAPIGHVDHNVPLLLNAPARLTVTPQAVEVVTNAEI